MGTKPEPGRIAKEISARAIHFVQARTTKLVAGAKQVADSGEHRGEKLASGAGDKAKSL